MRGTSNAIFCFSDSSKTVDHNLENSLSDLKYVNDWRTPLITFLALLKVAVLDCKEVLNIFIIPKTFFNIIITNNN